MALDDPTLEDNLAPNGPCFQTLAPQFSSSLDAYSPKTAQLQDGIWFERRPLAPPALLSLASAVQKNAVDILFSGDGLVNPTVSATIRVFDLANQHLLDSAAMKGFHSFILLPRPLPFTDSPSVYSLRSWANTIKAAMDTSGGGSPTQATLIIQSRFDSPTPTTLPLLDRRFELDPLRKYLSAIRIVTDLCLCHREEDGSVLPDRLPTPYPLMAFFYDSRASFSTNVSTEIWSDSAELPDCQSPADDVAMHVILNIAVPPGASRTPLTGLRVLMVLNGMDPSEASTNLRHASLLRYPPDFVPIIKKAAPESHTIADYHVPPSIVAHLVEDSEMLKESGIHWAILCEPLAGSLIINHQPRKAGQKFLKRPSPEVQDSLLAIPAIAKLLENTILLNKWDVWARPHPGVAVEFLAAQLQNLDDLGVACAAQQLRIRAPMGPPTVSPPDVLAVFPARVLPTTVIAIISQLIPLVQHQQMHRPGLLLLRLASPKVATIVYGTKLSSPQGSIFLTTGTDLGDTQWEKSHGLSRGASWDDRQPLISTLDDSHPPLSMESLQGLEASLSHPGPGNGT